MFVRAEGSGPPVLFIHGSATDHATWTIQLAALRSCVRCVLYDRRGTGRSPLPGGACHQGVEAHADDAAALLEEHGGGAPRVVVGQSFGAVVALELLRRHPERVKAAVLMEPPLAPVDGPATMAQELLTRFDAVAGEQGGPAAAEVFLRTVLGDASWERIPRPYQERSRQLWGPIRGDIAALGSYLPGYERLASVTAPVLLLAGERSNPYYLQTQKALHRALPNARLEVLEGAGHLMHADVFRRFNARLLALLEEQDER